LKHTGGQGSAIANVAPTRLSLFIVSRQVLRVPAQSPSHDWSIVPSGTAVSVMVWPGLNVAEQVPGQLMPGPVMLPPLGSSTISIGRLPNEADTVRSPFIVSVQVDRVPLQAPPHIRRPKPLAGLAVRVTRWPGRRVTVQAAGQSSPAPLTLPSTGGCTVSTGALVTVIGREANAVRPSGNVARTLIW
jgi:hypothetical protein